MRRRVVINDKGIEFIINGQNWMYRNNLESFDENITNGEVVDIFTSQNEYLATGMYSQKSHIVVRILSRNQNEVIDEKFYRNRIKFAYQFRKTLQWDQIDNCRLIFGEADGLPGLTVDRYNGLLVTQISSYGMEQIKDLIYATLVDVLKDDELIVEGIYERNDIAVREKEGLSQYKGFYGDKRCDTKTVIVENGIKINVDVENGQKTGYFLDQKNNRMLLQKMSRNKRVLDCFTHTGGFALNAAKGGAKEVTAVDVSQTALDQALENAKMNSLEGRMKFVKDDVFKYLEKCKKGQFDIIVLDPPAFTKSRRTIDHAYNGYKEINLKAMNLLENGGYLISCSCSRFMEIDNYEKMLKQAAKEANVTLKQVSVTQQNHDHPILWNMDETSYLKFYIFQVLKEK